MQIHAVDGTYELYRAYHGAPSAKDPTGREVGATRGFLRSMLALLRTDGVTHVGVAFDTVIESFRNDLFGGYKTGDGIEPELWAQFPLVERAARALGMATWSMLEFEADDALATIAARYRDDPAVTRVVLCSPDKDLAQCVRGTRVVCWDRMRRVELDEPGVVAKFGVPPASIPDYLALVGDSADGIPGVPRWGAKSAAAVLSRYGRVDAIPDDAESWDVPVRGKAALAQNLCARRDDAALYRTLATLRTDVPIAEGLRDLAWRGARRAELAALCAELGDTAFAGRVERFRD